MIKTNCTWQEVYVIYNTLLPYEKLYLGNHFFDSPNTVFRWIVKRKSKNAGFIEMYDMKRTGSCKGELIVSIAIQEKYRGTGVLQELQNAAEQFASSNSKYNRLIWLAKDNNKKSIHCAEKLGYTKKYHELDHWVFVKTIKKFGLTPEEFMVRCIDKGKVIYSEIDSIPVQESKNMPMVFSEDDVYCNMSKFRNPYYHTSLISIKYDFGDKNYGIAFVARDCLDMLGYKYNDARPNDAIYKFVSKENIINGKNATPHTDAGWKNNIYIRTKRNHNQIKPVVMVTQNGFFELVGRSNMPDAKKFQHWMYNEVIPAVYNGESTANKYHSNGGTFEFMDYIHEEVGIPSIRGTKAEQIKELISNYSKLRGDGIYPLAARDFKKAFWNKYRININKLKGNEAEYQKIVDNGLYDQAKDVLNELISQCSNANTGYTAEEATQLANVITDLSYKNNVYKDFINSVPNCTIIDGIPYQRKRVVKRLTDEQIDVINKYANEHNIDIVEAMHVLFG